MARELLRSQRNEVFKMIGEAGLSVDRFKWAKRQSRHTEEDDSDRGVLVVSLQYLSDEDNYYFAFDEREGQASSYFSPGRETSEEDAFSGSWEQQRRAVASWLGYLSRELAEPYLWTPAFAADPHLPEADASPMTDADVAHVLKAVDEVRRLVASSAEIAENERGTMLEILQEVQVASGRREESGSRLSRAEMWKTIVGQVVSEVTKATLTAAAGKWLLLHLTAALGWVRTLAAEAIKQLGE